MADTTNNPQLVKFNELRKEAVMMGLEKRVKEHFVGATKSVELLRIDLLTAHSMMSKRSCAGQFSAWLSIVGIPRSTAYYILGAKRNGKFASEGTGKWGAPNPKPLSKKQKQAMKRRGTQVFTKRVIAMLKKRTSQQAREMLSGLFSKAFPDAAPLTERPKRFSLAEAIERENKWKEATEELKQIQLGDEALLRMPAEDLEAAITAIRAAKNLPSKKPVTSVEAGQRKLAQA